MLERIIMSVYIMECCHSCDVHVTMVVINWTVGTQGNMLGPYVKSRCEYRVLSATIRISHPRSLLEHSKHIAVFQDLEKIMQTLITHEHVLSAISISNKMVDQHNASMKVRGVLVTLQYYRQQDCSSQHTLQVQTYGSHHKVSQAAMCFFIWLV